MIVKIIIKRLNVQKKNKRLFQFNKNLCLKVKTSPLFTMITSCLML